METDTKRRKYIDCARGIAMIFVIIGHVGIKNPLIQFIYSFHMPLFFFIMGMTSGKSLSESYYQYVYRKFKAIFIPYTVVALIFSNGYLRSFLCVIYGSRSLIAEADSLTSFWFLPCYFVSCILFNGILRLASWGGIESI